MSHPKFTGSILIVVYFLDIEISSSGPAGTRQFPLMGLYMLTSQRIKHFPVYKKTDDERYLFLGPTGYWRIGPDTRTFKGSGLRFPEKNPTLPAPPFSGWQFWDGRWKDDFDIIFDTTGRQNLKI